MDLGACSHRKFLNLGSRKSYSSVFLGTFSVNWYAGKCSPAPEISLGKDWLDQWSKVPTEFHNIRMIRKSCCNTLCVMGSHLGWASKLLRDYFSRFLPNRPPLPKWFWHSSKMAARNAKCSILTILRKNRDCEGWTVCSAMYQIWIGQ